MICIAHQIILRFSNQGGWDLQEIKSNVQTNNHYIQYNSLYYSEIFIPET